MDPISSETAVLARYLAGGASLDLGPAVAERARMHLCDSLAAAVSGSALPAGVAARTWFEATLGKDPAGGASVLGHGLRGPAAFVAACNGMAAHADETDDSHAPSLSHPGCSVVPAALAVGEELGRPGREVLRAVVVGYDVGCRIGRAMHSAGRTRETGRWSSHSVVGTFCSAAAAGVLYHVGEEAARYLLSYAAQLSSGVTTWVRDSHHVEKAFVFGGMPANHGVLAGSLVASGCDGVADVFSGSPNYFEAMTETPERGALVGQLGEQFEIMQATIKKYAVGSPSQAAVEAVVELLDEERLVAEEIDEIELRLPADSAVIVDNRAMPNVNVQYLVAGTLLDGRFSLQMSHDERRMSDPAVTALMARTVLVADPELAGTRSAVVRLRRGDGVVERRVTSVRGTPADPMRWVEVRAKAEDLMSGVLGDEGSRHVCDLVEAVEELDDIAELARACIPQRVTDGEG